MVVGGFNFGTGSSREQAVTALKCAGIPLVIAGSFSQTYLRNAFNNGFLCIETPELVNRLREKYADAISSKEKTIIPGDVIEVDFAASTIRYARRGVHLPGAGLGAAVTGGRRRRREPGERETAGSERSCCNSLDSPTAWDVWHETSRSSSSWQNIPS